MGMPSVPWTTRGGAARRAILAGLLSALIGLGCGGSGPDAASPAAAGEQPVAPPAAPPPDSPADVTVLMMGNSHTSSNDLPQHLATMLASGSGRSVSATTAPGWMFLEERLADAASTQLLASRRWTVVVLQAQKYSTSGQFVYSTREAQEWIRRARAVGALPVMFPEWSRRGIDETARIYDLHVSIAQAEPACVAPVGQAWDLAAQRLPGLALHAADGNHASPAGSYLAGLMLYATITGASPLGLPDQANGVAASVQAQLRQVAADTAQAVAPRRHCPSDIPLLSSALGDKP